MPTGRNGRIICWPPLLIGDLNQKAKVKRGLRNRLSLNIWWTLSVVRVARTK
jgi:hypothetical protein